MSFQVSLSSSVTSFSPIPLMNEKRKKQEKIVGEQIQLEKPAGDRPQLQVGEEKRPYCIVSMFYSGM